MNGSSRCTALNRPVGPHVPCSDMVWLEVTGHGRERCAYTLLFRALKPWSVPSSQPNIRRVRYSMAPTLHRPTCDHALPAHARRIGPSPRPTPYPHLGPHTPCRPQALRIDLSRMGSTGSFSLVYSGAFDVTCSSAPAGGWDVRVARLAGASAAPRCPSASVDAAIGELPLMSAACAPFRNLHAACQMRCRRVDRPCRHASPTTPCLP
jgi:hypothetical protein